MCAAAATRWDQVRPGVPALRHEHALSEAGEGPIDLRVIEACERARAASEPLYFAELLRVLTGRNYPPRDAKALWQRILEHRSALRRQLGQNPGVAVAALDLLHSSKERLACPTVIDALFEDSDEGSALRNAVTGLRSECALEQSVARMLTAEPRRLSVLLLAVDSLPDLRSARGALAADHVLSRVADLTRTQLRACDTAVHCEGERLCILMPGRFLEEALILGHRLRDRIASELSEFDVAVSLGVSAHPHHASDARGLLEAATLALSESQRIGKNRVSVLPCEASFEL